MPQKEIRINGKFYWELNQKDEIQVFMEMPDAFFWNNNNIPIFGKIICCCKKGTRAAAPFMDELGNFFSYCVLLSSEHKKESRRCTNREIMQWCASKGFWMDAYNQIRIDPVRNKRETLNEPCSLSVVSICAWDGEPMEPTAENMGLEE